MVENQQICPTCNASLPASVEECPNCGQLLPIASTEPEDHPIENAAASDVIGALIQVARRLKKRGNLGGALENYHQALEMTPSDSDLAQELGMIVQFLEEQIQPLRSDQPKIVEGKVGELPGFLEKRVVAGPEILQLKEAQEIAPHSKDGKQAQRKPSSIVQPPQALKTSDQAAYFKMLRVIRAKRSGLVDRLLGPPTVWSVAFSLDGRQIAAATSQGDIWFWPAEEGGEELNWESAQSGAILSLAFSPDGSWLASAGEEGAVCLWPLKAETITIVQKLAGHDDWVNYVVFSPKETMLFSAGDDGVIKEWQLSNGRLLRTFKGHSSEILGLAISPDGCFLASASNDCEIKLWDLSSGRQLRTLEHTSAVWAVAFSPEGTLLASGLEDGTAKLWHLWSQESKPLVLKGHTGGVNSVSFSPDGTMLATGADDCNIRLWDAHTGEQLRVLSGHTDAVESVTFSPNGGLLASASDDGTVRLWGGKP